MSNETLNTGNETIMFANTRKFFLAALASLAVVGAASSVASAHEPVQRHRHRPGTIGSLASRLEREARSLNREADSHFRNAPDYRVFERQVDEIVRLADHIHSVADRRGDFRHLRHDVEKLNRLYQASERLFERMVAFRRLDRETVFHLRHAMNNVERSINELRIALSF